MFILKFSKFSYLSGGLLLFALLIMSAPAQAVRCGSKLINEGDPSSRLQRYCPEPFWVEQWSNPAILDNSPYAVQLTDGMQAWYINFGPRKLIRRMVFRNDILVSEQTLGYGFHRAPEKTNCRASDLDAVGNTLAELYKECGPPDNESYYPVTIYPRHYGQVQPIPGYGYPAQSVTVYRLVWTYYPPRSDSRVFHIEDGKIVQRLKYRD